MAGINTPSGSKYKINGIDIESYSNNNYTTLLSKSGTLDYLLDVNPNKPFPYTYKGTYYVATNGSDSNPGTFALPYATLNKALSVVAAGETIYMRGGTYDANINKSGTNRATLVSAKVGTPSSIYKLYAYPGEKVIIDYTNITYAGLRMGIYFANCEYWHIKGIEFTNIKQYNAELVRLFNLIDCNHMLIENCSFHDNEGGGTRCGGSYDDIEFRNCDGYNNYDAATLGENSDGFAAQDNSNVNGVTRFINCRAWNNADDGFDIWRNNGIVIFENCWAGHNGYVYGTETSSGNGNGFKFGETTVSRPTEVTRIVKNCVAFDNRQYGFNQNNADSIIQMYNCTSFRNGVRGFWFFLKNNAYVLRNNISYKDPENVFMSNTIHDHNTWDIPITVVDSDFISLDPAGMTANRSLDGTLPTTGFLKLRDGSQLIQAGTNVGIPFFKNAPDLGAYPYYKEGELSHKQDLLVSGTTLKTINSTNLLGSGNISVQPTLVSGTNIKTVNGTSLLGSGNINISGGTVSSVAMTVPTGLTITGSPITSSGTLALTLTSGYSIPTTTNQTNWNTAYTNNHTHSNKSYLDAVGNNTIYHTGNLNLSTVDFTTKTLRVIDKLGIGTTSPGSSIHIKMSDPGQPRGVTIENIGSFINSGSILLRKALGTIASPLPVVTGNSIGAVCFAGFQGTTTYPSGYCSHSGIIQCWAAEDFDDVHLGTDMTIQLIKKGVGYNVSEHTRFTSEGNIGVGTTTPESKLELYGNLPYIKSSFTGSVAKGRIGQFTADNSYITNNLCWIGSGWIRDSVAQPSSLMQIGTNGLGIFSDIAGTTLNPTERMRIFTNGNVRIGTTASTYKLEVGGDINISSGSKYKINGTNLSYTDVGAGSIAGKTYWSGTLAAYNALGSYDSNTIYFIAN